MSENGILRNDISQNGHTQHQAASQVDSTSFKGPNGAAAMKCQPSSSIEVLIVGAGLGGMFAAIECHRQGHDVKIIEAKEKMEGLGKKYFDCN